jgi:hypothetical protein
LGLSWKELESDTGVAAPHMRGPAKGGRTAFPGVLRLTSWLDEPLAHFVRPSPF